MNDKTPEINKTIKNNTGGFRLLMKSAVFRLAFIMFIIIVPVCILTMVMSNRAIRMAETQVSDDIQEALKLNMNQLDNYLQNIGRRLYTISRENEDFAFLMTATEESDVIDSMHAYMRLSGVLTDIQSEYTWTDNVFAWFPDNDMFVTAKGFQTQETRDILLAEISGAEEDRGSWSTAQSDPNLLIGIFSYRNVFFGAVFKLDMLQKEIIQMNTDANIVYFEVYQEEDDQNDNKEIIISGEKYIRIEARSQHSNLVLTDLVSRSQLDRTLPGYMRALFIISIVFLACIPILYLSFRGWLVRPINILIDAIRNVDNGNLNYRIEEKAGTYEFDLLNTNFNEMMDSVKDLKINVYEKELERQDIRLQYLSQQIQPHFILNAMNIIYSYEPEEYELIQKMVLCLSRYFQFIVNANRPYVRVKDELDHIMNYLTIQKIRYGERIDFQVDTDASAENAVMPPLMIQNLVENIIKYALKDDETVLITVQAECIDEMITIRIRDTGEGINDDTLALIHAFKETKVRQEGLGVGIQNTIERLELFFGEKAAFDAERWNGDSGTQIVLTFPARYEEEFADKELTIDADDSLF